MTHTAGSLGLAKATLAFLAVRVVVRIVNDIELDDGGGVDGSSVS